jgi:hypothetical protein
VVDEEVSVWVGAGGWGFEGGRVAGTVGEWVVGWRKGWWWYASSGCWLQWVLAAVGGAMCVVDEHWRAAGRLHLRGRWLMLDEEVSV